MAKLKHPMAKKQKLKDLEAFRQQVIALEECEMMIHHAQSNGKHVPQHTLKVLSDMQAIRNDLEKEVAGGKAENLDPRSLNMSIIGDMYKDVTEVLAPSSPSTVIMLEREKRKGLAGMFGQVPLVRWLNSITLFCLLTFLGVFFFEEVDSYSINGDILSYEPRAFVLNELVIIAIAALGAAFYNLFEAHKYISNNSYDTKYDSIYWMRFVLGIVSGVILSQFIFVSPEIVGSDPGNTAENINKSQELGGFITYKPLLAFLGGFSARVVHKILNSLVDSIETFVTGSARDMVKAREEAAKVQMKEKINALKQKNAQTKAVERVQMTMQLMKLEKQMATDGASEDVQKQMKKMMNEMMKSVGGDDVHFDDNNTVVDDNNNDYVPVVDDFKDDPIVVDDYDDVEIGDDVDDIDVPEFPEDLDNPDFPMPGDLKDDPKSK